MGEFSIGLFSAAIILGITAVIHQQYRDNRLLARLPMAMGALMAFGSWWLPWLALDLFGVIPFNDLNRFLTELGIGVTQMFIEMIGNENMEQVAWLLGQEMPGWMVVGLMPSVVILPRVVISLVFFSGMGMGVALLLSFIPNSTFQKIVLGGAIGWSFFLAVLLLLQLPAIDAWGTHDTFWQALGVAVLGARLGWGAWVGFFGILLAGIGGAIVLGSESESRTVNSWEDPPLTSEWS